MQETAKPYVTQHGEFKAALVCSPRSWWAAAIVLLAHQLGAPGGETPSLFPTPHNTQDESIPLLSAEQALRSVDVPDGFRVTLFASEPAVRQPIAMALDGRGRLWVAENYTYAERTVNYDLGLRDRIVILEDTDHDGHYDQRTVFWDEGVRLTSVELGFGGVWVLCPPQLLFIPDRDRDDVPDDKPVVLLDGWDVEAVRHNFVNGLRWGPDGWLYGRHGIQGTSQVGAPGTSAEKRTKINCGIWRFHPIRRDFEVVCRGTTNPWGADWNEYGEMFFINTVIGHLWHVIPGAHYQRMYGEDFGPYLYQLIGQTADHFHWDRRETWSDVRNMGVTDATSRAGGGHAHSGLMIYLGDNWPGKYRKQLFTLNFHGRRVNCDQLRRQGATYIGSHRPDFMTVGDPWFRGIDLTYGPDGGVYVLDWSDIGECHENDGVHRTSGRIYKVVYGSPDPPDSIPIGQRTSEELVRLQRHGNAWYARQARRALHERHARGDDLQPGVRSLFTMFDDEVDPACRLRAMWCLHVTEATTTPWLLKQLQHEDEHVRAWAVRLLVEGEASPEIGAALVRQTERETSGLVLTYLASAMQRVEPRDRWRMARQLLRRGSFADDRVFPLMIWYGIASIVADDPAGATELIARSRIPLVSRFIARRLTSELDAAPGAIEPLVDWLFRADDTQQQLAALRGMTEALRGWRRATPPDNWTSTAARLRAKGQTEIRTLVDELAVVFGDGRAVEQLRNVASDAGVELPTRRRAIEALVDARAPGCDRLLDKLLHDRDLAPAAVRGLVALGQVNTAEVLLRQYAGFSQTAREAVIESLASRPDYAQDLLRSVDAGAVPREDVTPFVLRQIQLTGNQGLNEEIQRLWPHLRLIATDKLRQIQVYRQWLTTERRSQADLPSGRRLFEQSCAKCHRLFGHGGDIAPDLTGGQRDNLNYWLENVLDPSASVASEFRMSIIRLDDGRILTGVVSELTDRTIAVQTDAEKRVLDRNTVASIDGSDRSLMPDGLLDVLTKRQVRDLIGYLMGDGQVPLNQGGQDIEPASAVARPGTD